MSFNITLITYGVSATAEQEELLKSVVDSVAFTKALQKPATNTGIWSVGGAVLLGVIIYNINSASKRRKARNSSTNSGTNSGADKGGNVQQ
jgi:hypothetical protein